MDELYLASTWRRLCAFAFDLIAGAAFGLLVWFSLKELGFGAAWILGPGSFYAYFVLSYRFLSRTPGKWLLGLYVVGYDGRRRLSWTRCFIRGFVQIVSPLLSLIPQIMALFREDRKQLADVLAGTQVMQKTPRMWPPRERRKLAMVWIFIFLGVSTLILYRYFSHA